MRYNVLVKDLSARYREIRYPLNAGITAILLVANTIVVGIQLSRTTQMKFLWPVMTIGVGMPIFWLFTWRACRAIKLLAADHNPVSARMATVATVSLWQMFIRAALFGAIVLGALWNFSKG